MSLKGKTLFITGASRGIGLAIALRAARDGANIAIAAKTETPHPKLEGTIHLAAEAIEKAGGRALPLVVDVRDEAAVQGAIDQTAARFGSLDIVVNNASAISLAPVAQTDMKRFDLMHQINARGTFMVSKYAIAHLERAQNPHILTLSPPPWWSLGSPASCAPRASPSTHCGPGPRSRPPPSRTSSGATPGRPRTGRKSEFLSEHRLACSNSLQPDPDPANHRTRRPPSSHRA
jgi:NAD(P)-dependent dehydrogenase (short-subunit alcohol dehydrogenase family)